MAEVEQGKNKDFLGTSLSFPLRRNVQGSLQLSSSERNIEESIRIILATRHGERVYRPKFGCRLSELVFAPMNTKTLLMTRLYVEEALTLWEPRIDINEIYTEPDPVRGCINIIIRYSTKETHSSGSLVYPFYLLPGGQ
ncbi:GPW/gp25 family protein [Spirulina sp. 06S082]|uniref:GPW/gp25 family protein n=1 Tax=Spirulina sp. 06S082 TaxID=3110248 RepID=UPI002B1F0F17|nr:GPW/gp25 family protein [Spirulina sp. 06S082]MEA5468481.1 GPW/gp25 family protein [Spirulina sp. 06S082]